MTTEVRVKERPILFSAPMVRAILEGKKTQTRRVVKPQPPASTTFAGEMHCSDSKHDNSFWWMTGDPHDCDEWVSVEGTEPFFCPYGKPGDRLWVRETWTGTWHSALMHVHYAADGSENLVCAPSGYTIPKAALSVGNWVTPLFMPRWASRITLEIVKVRVERVQDITEEDAIAEGMTCDEGYYCEAPTEESEGVHRCNMTRGFEALWNSINAKRGFGWDSNPWVWVIEFKKV